MGIKERMYDRPPLYENIPEEELTNLQLLERFDRDPSYLPSYKALLRVFNSEETSEGNMELWKEHVRNKTIFEVLTQEFISALSEYLGERVGKLAEKSELPIRILEVGAGNGRLTHFLRQKLEANIPGMFEIIPTDKNEFLMSNYPVERIGHQEALAKYAPQIVIFCWMPHRLDLTEDFRATESVEEYILIGETDGGCCGHEWLTWGYPFGGKDSETIPYIADGFERQDLDMGEQVSRTSRPYEDGIYGDTSTVSFKRKSK